MKNIIYFNKEFTEDDYEIKQLSINIKDEDLDYYLNIINNSYGKYGEVITKDITVVPTDSERITSIEAMLTKIMGV